MKKVFGQEKTALKEGWEKFFQADDIFDLERQLAQEPKKPSRKVSFCRKVGAIPEKKEP